MERTLYHNLHAKTPGGSEADREHVWRYFSDIPDTVDIFSASAPETYEKAWHTEEHPRNARFRLQCHLYELPGHFADSSRLRLSSDPAATLRPHGSRLPTLYTTIVSHTNGPESQLNLRRSVASFQTCRPPKLAWIKVFMQAFGFDIVEESDDSRSEMDWSRKLACGYTIKVEDEEQNMRLAEYLHSIDHDHDVHTSSDKSTPWHIAPHREGAPHMQCNTLKPVGKRFYETVISEHRHGAATAELLKIETVAFPKATWLKVLASRASGKPIPAGF